MRVAVVTTSFPLRAESTSGVFVQRMVEALPECVRAEVVVPADSGAAAPPANDRRYELLACRYAPRRLRTLAHGPGGIPEALRARPLLWMLLPVMLGALFVGVLRASRRADLIHANWSINGALAGVVGLLARRPVITTLRGTDIARVARSRMDALLLAVCVRLSARVVGVSEAIALALCARFPAQAHKFTSLPNGVDDDLLLGRRALSTQDGVRLLAVHSLTKNKGCAVLLKALAGLSDELAIHLKVLGDGPERGHLQALARELGVEHRVAFVGSVPPARVAEYLGDADILLLASYSEGRPNVVLEAMAAGLPVIASRIPGVTELVQEGISGLLFPAGDAQALRACIETLAAAPERRLEMGAAGRRFIVENKLSWSETGRRYAALYDQVITERRDA